ncbi:MAG: heme exporter protein CcmD [Alphaproteobacteria bacterium]|nr:heme exporter protein CcmD [Alphaproteobacteria bacterium]
MAEFFAMDGYAWFVWPTYVATLGFMAWLAISTWRGLKADRKVLAELEKDAPHRARRRESGATDSTPLSGTQTSDA